MMQPVPVTMLPTPPRIRPRTALVASADPSFRQRLTHILTGLRWQVREAEGGAQAWAEAENWPMEAVIVDSWLPDLDVAEFLTDFRGIYPQVDLITASGTPQQEGPRGPYRQELLYAMRRSQDTDTAAWNAPPALIASQYRCRPPGLAGAGCGSRHPSPGRFRFEGRRAACLRTAAGVA